MAVATIEDRLKAVGEGDTKALARCISAIENNAANADELLMSLRPDYSIPVIGITGSPGAGKSTLLNAILSELSEQNLKIAVLAIDPSSPFNLGSLLGDRIRMNAHVGNPNIFIRSLASRGSLGGLSGRTIEVTDLLRCAPFDYIFVETVGVGQSEIEIAGLADITVLVTTPDSGDDVQLIKAGIMEIASIFVVNKTDLDPEGKYAGKLKKLVYNHDNPESSTPVLEVRATGTEGISELTGLLRDHSRYKDSDKRATLLAIKLVRIIQEMKTRGLDTETVKKEIVKGLEKGDFNLYRYAKKLSAEL